MNEKIINAVTDFLSVKSRRGIEKGSDDYQILKYGIEVFYYEATKTVLLIILSVALGIVPYTLTFMAVFGGLRLFARGIHFKSPALCFVMGFSSYIGGTYLAQYIKINLLIVLAVYAVCLFLNIIYAPSPTENTPISKDECPTLKKRLIVVLVVLLLILLIIGENAYRNIVLFALVMESVYVLPCTYKFFNEKRG